MKFSTGLLIAFATSSLASGSPRLHARQETEDPLARVQQVIEDARAASAAEIQQDSATRGRRLSSSQCGPNCQSCRTGAAFRAAGEVALCGTIALAAEVATAGITTILEVAGFFACEVAVIGSLQESEANCNALGP